MVITIKNPRIISKANARNASPKSCGGCKIAGCTILKYYVNILSTKYVFEILKSNILDFVTNKQNAAPITPPIICITIYSIPVKIPIFLVMRVASVMIGLKCAPLTVTAMVSCKFCEMSCYILGANI